MCSLPVKFLLRQRNLLPAAAVVALNAITSTIDLRCLLRFAVFLALLTLFGWSGHDLKVGERRSWGQQ